MKKRILLTLLLLSLSGCRSFNEDRPWPNIWEWETLDKWGVSYEDKREVVAFHDKFHEIIENDNEK